MKNNFGKFLLLSTVVLGSFLYMSCSTQGYASTSSQEIHKDSKSAIAAQNYALPNGASSLNETYQDWVVLCQNSTSGGHCLISQQQSDRKTHQQVLSIQMAPNGNSESVQGVAIMPFGLELSKGVSIIADSKPVVTSLAFTTCVPSGCIVPLNLSQQQIATIESAKKLEIKASSFNDRSVSILVSNKGMSKALARIHDLIQTKNSNKK